MPPTRRLDAAAAAVAVQAQRDLLREHGHPVDTPEASSPADELIALVAAGIQAGIAPGRQALKLAVRLLADRFAAAHPGRSVELRIPPFAAVQCVTGPRHTRGTPPNVVETDGATFVGLTCGFVVWEEALVAGKVRASGERSDLRAFLPMPLPSRQSGGP
jgi:hypothetical protein